MKIEFINNTPYGTVLRMKEPIKRGQTQLLSFEIDKINEKENRFMLRRVMRTDSPIVHSTHRKIVKFGCLNDCISYIKDNYGYDVKFLDNPIKE